MDIALNHIKEFLKSYDGPPMRIMEVCGSHTGAIAKEGIYSLLSPSIKLLSGPGCPVCVTPTAYIDRLIELSLEPSTCVVTFGDLLRVPGSRSSLSQMKGEGARVEMVYSPMDTIKLARQEPDTRFIFAAVGFETTTPVYAVMLDQILEEHIPNVRLLTALKNMPEVIDSLLSQNASLDGFLAPGHVSVVTGSHVFLPLAEKYQVPFGVAGFSGEEILLALYGIVKARGQGRVMNFYPSVVSAQGNREAQKMVDRYFEKADAAWRGLGLVPGSGRILRPEYAAYDAGSRELTEDHKKNPACCCDQVLMGKMSPTSCPLFGKACTPLKPQGACMVSREGNCFSYFVNHRE
ncbi:MAG: hydrogenase formation protein HypD [Eubacterium sp.]|nr:hydrogenase formation protein HypD [Eubacterium sp.]